MTATARKSPAPKPASAKPAAFDFVAATKVARDAEALPSTDRGSGAETLAVLKLLDDSWSKRAVNAKDKKEYGSVKELDIHESAKSQLETLLSNAVTKRPYGKQLRFGVTGDDGMLVAAFRARTKTVGAGRPKKGK